MVIFHSYVKLPEGKSVSQWIGLVGKILTGKPHMNNGKITLVSGVDFPLNQSIDWGCGLSDISSILGWSENVGDLPDNR